MYSNNQEWRPWSELERKRKRLDPTASTIKRHLKFPNGTTWEIGNLISSPYEERSVYECKRICTNPSDPCAGRKGVVKLKMQVRLFWGDEESAEPTDDFNEWTWSEIRALETLRDKGCEHAPLLIDHKSEQQDKCGFFPGAYVCYLLMEWVPGIQLVDFWDYSWQERDRIRRAFKIALTNVQRCAVVQNDQALRNILWDEPNGKCYIMDYENSESWDDDYIKANAFSARGERELLGWRNSYFAHWKLLEWHPDPDGPNTYLDGSDLSTYLSHPGVFEAYQKHWKLVACADQQWRLVNGYGPPPTDPELDNTENHEQQPPPGSPQSDESS